MNKPIKVILVDDHPLVLDGMSECLKDDAQIEIIATFNSSIKALEFIEEHTPDVIVTDVRMPEMNGIEMAKKIKSRFGESVKIVMLSGYDYEEYQISSFEVGVNAFVPKNSSYQQIINAIKQSYLGNIIYSKCALKSEERLTDTEIRILRLVAKEKTNKEIAKELLVSQRTIESHITSILRKLHADSRVGAVTKGFQKGILSDL